MEFKSLKGTSIREILSAFNQSFDGYFIPIRLSEAQLRSKMKADKIDLELSVGTFEEDKLIAFILHGFDTIEDQKTVYNGGTGVIPKKRGLGLTKQMYAYSLPLLKEKGIQRIVLEVISENIQAIKTYKHVGFTEKRKLACFKGSIKAHRTNSQFKIKNMEGHPWEELETFWDVSPTWQNSVAVLKGIRSETISLGAYLDDKLLGYIIYQPKIKRLHQIAVHKAFRNKGVASSLMAELANEYGQNCSILNVDHRTEELIAFFESIGLENQVDQLEMELKID